MLPLPGSSILLAEDSEDTARLIKYSLELAGYNVLLATDGSEALQMIEASIPDLLITDLLMPGLSGHELMAELQKKGINIRTIVLAVSHTDEDVVMSFSKGAIDFIRKPFSPRELVARVRGVMAR